MGIKPVGRCKRGKIIWLFKCDCGVFIEALGTSVKNFNTKSCGCLNTESKTKHNGCKDKLYVVWKSMVDRCYNPKCKGYKYYGAKGVKLCEAWKSNYGNFRSDMEPTYMPGLSIDRIDSKGNYEPSNCRWATREVQNNNKSSNVYLNSPWGRLPLNKVAKIIGISKTGLGLRIKRNWPQDKLFTPSKKAKTL